jgi:hypothetical protein
MAPRTGAKICLELKDQRLRGSTTIKRVGRISLGRAIMTMILIALLLGLVVPGVAQTQAEEPGPQCWAVLVGLTSYQDAETEPLSFSDDDARALSQALQWGEQNMKVLLNEQATRSNIEEAVLGWLEPLEDADDTVLVYFSGIWDSTNDCFMCYDSSESTWSGDITPWDLDSWLDQLDSTKVAVILDSGLQTAENSTFYQMLRQSGRMLMAPASPGETSWEDFELGHGVFTNYLLEAFAEWETCDENGDCKLSAEEAFKYAEPRVVEDRGVDRTQQHPMLVDEVPGELSLAVKARFDTGDPVPPYAKILTVDSQEYTKSDLPIELTFPPGATTVLEVPSEITPEEGVRYTFTSWDDGETSASRPISQGGAYVAGYDHEVYVTVESEHGSPSGEGWYSAGEQVTIEVPSKVGTIIQQEFTGWSGDFTVAADWRTSYIWLQVLLAVGFGLLGAIPLAITLYRYLRKGREAKPSPPSTGGEQT